jgi:Glycosyltransferase WbsX
MRLIAFYLPQFHPIPENDQWWGKGFTEWTNVVKAKPHFPGHYQPHIPADLGFYDLRVPEVREAQAQLAREYGIDAFCYWHYWFSGERLLERPFQEVLRSGRPRFPFCLGWANHDWSGLWSGGDSKRILKSQTYHVKDENKKHFEFLLEAFEDPRYLRVGGKPLFVIYKPREIPDCRALLDYWRELALKNGLRGLLFVATLDYAERHWDAEASGFDAVTIWPLNGGLRDCKPYLWSTRIKNSLEHSSFRRLRWIAKQHIWPGRNEIYQYSEVLPRLVCDGRPTQLHYRMVVPNWDTTPRYGINALVLHESTPELFQCHLRHVFQETSTRAEEEQIVFITWSRIFVLAMGICRLSRKNYFASNNTHLFLLVLELARFHFQMDSTGLELE